MHSEIVFPLTTMPAIASENKCEKVERISRRRQNSATTNKTAYTIVLSWMRMFLALVVGTGANAKCLWININVVLTVSPLGIPSYAPYVFDLNRILEKQKKKNTPHPSHSLSLSIYIPLSISHPVGGLLLTTYIFSSSSPFSWWSSKSRQKIEFHLELVGA